MEPSSKILLIYTGGTIGMIKSPETNALKAFDFSELLSHVPEIRLLKHTIDSISFEKPIDSSNIHPVHYQKMASIVEENYEDYDGFVILHGSDTMAYSASALSFMFENLSKPIIFTGSQLPIGDLRTDAKENLITAIQLAGLKQGNRMLINEVGLYFEYKLLRGNRSSKVNSEHFEAFESPNFPPLAISGMDLKVNHPLLRRAHPSRRLKIHKNLDENVLILKIFPGMNRNIITAILNSKDIKGILLETFGTGNAPDEDWFIELISECIKSGKYVVNVTQCVGGGVFMGRYETSTRLKNVGVISGKDMTTEAAISKMMFLLSKNLSPKVFKTIYETSLRGELG